MSNQFFEDVIIKLIVTETNQYAQQNIARKQLCCAAPMTRWKDITTEEMKIFK